MIIPFDKEFKNDRYAILFNTKTGVEITTGINGHDDPFVTEMPTLLDIGVMGTCKHKCKFCYQGHEDRPNMRLSDFKKIIDEASYHTNQVALGGHGDPNQHEYFGDMIEHCCKKGVVPNYTTSGIDITDEQIEISKMCGAVAISEYEQKYTYDALTRLIEAGIKTNIHQIYSKESHIKCIGIVQGQIPDIWQFDHTGLNAVIFLLFKPHGAGKNLKYLIPTKTQLKYMGMNIFKPQARFKIGMDSCLANHVLVNGEPSKIQRMSVDTCEAARMSAYITPDMKFMPCSFADETTFATPIIDGLKPIWDRGGSFKTFREQLTHNNACCPLFL